MFVAKGARVVLIRNLWTAARLVNGSQGTIQYIVYREDSDTSEQGMPDLLLLKFPDYKGPSYLDNESHIVPIVPTEASWTNKKHEPMRRRQFPLINGYGISIHKSQGEPTVGYYAY